MEFKHRAGAVLRLAAVIGAVFLGVAPVWAHAAPHGAHGGNVQSSRSNERFRSYARTHNARAHRDRWEPYTGTVGGEGWPVYRSRFAVPACIVNAESHGLVHEHSHPWGSSGLYQLELSNWTHWKRRGWPEFPYQGTKLQQSIVATDVLRSQGIHAWTTAYGCGY